MAVYKIPQDVEADDKFLGPLSFRQFIFADIVMIAGYVSFLFLTKGFPFGIVLTLPIMLLFGFLAFPFGREQPNEIWLAAQVRFFIKPRKRIWNQDGIKELVHVIVPKREVHKYTDGLSQTEVKSRLSALASMMDTRGWAVKNVSTIDYATPGFINQNNDTDRLIDTTSLPAGVPIISDDDAVDMLDEDTSEVAHQFDSMIKKSEADHRGEIIERLQHAREHPKETAEELGIPTSQDDFWFAHEANTKAVSQQFTNPQPDPGHTTVLDSSALSPTASTVVPDSPTATNYPVQTMVTEEPLDEAGFLDKVHKEKQRQHDQLQAINTHMTVVSEDGSIHGKNQEVQTNSDPTQNQKSTMTPTPDPGILQLATNNDLNVATIARQAEKNNRDKNLPNDEVVVSLR